MHANQRQVIWSSVVFHAIKQSSPLLTHCSSKCLCFDRYQCFRSSHPYSFPLDLFFFIIFQDVAGNSLGLLPPSFPAAIVDSGKCRCNNRFPKSFTETVREFPIKVEHARTRLKRFHAR